MKKALIISICAISLANGCASEESTIRSVAQHYLDAMANYDVGKAEPYCTPETQNGVIVFARNMMANADTNMELNAYIQSNTPADVVINDINIQNDTTAVVQYHKHTPIKEQDGELKLVKRNGKWLVHILMAKQPVPALKADTVRINGNEVILHSFPKEKK